MNEIEILEKNLKDVKKRIGEAASRAGRDPGDITLVAVTKHVAAPIVELACSLGLDEFGENRVQEARDKISLVRPKANWHFIGHLQTNKVRQMLTLFKMIHSLDRLSLARELQRQCERHDTVCKALIQVNVSKEDTKHGVYPEELFDLMAEIQRFDRICVKGLMTMAPYTEDKDLIRSVFRDLRLLAKEAEEREYKHTQMEHLSMGMTSDFEIAIEEGATMLRIGSAIFGGLTSPTK